MDLLSAQSGRDGVRGRIRRVVVAEDESLIRMDLVERAKSVLIASNAMTEPEAFAWT